MHPPDALVGDMMRRILRNPLRKLRGQNLVELALLLPILLLIFFAMVEVAWWAHSYITIATAAREGARFGSRALHLPTDEIADVTSIAMSGGVNVDLVGADANTAIIVTEIDVDPDGSYTINESLKLGDLAATTDVCLIDPCPSGSINIKIMRDENVTFNGNSILCTEALGCRNDFVVVEVFHEHSMALGTIFSTKYLPNPIATNAHGVMRVLFRRRPTESNSIQNGVAYSGVLPLGDLIGDA